MGKNHIRLAQVCPGMVETEFLVSMAAGDKEKADKMRASISMKGLEAKDIADSVEHTLACPRHVQIHDILIRPTEQAV